MSKTIIVTGASGGIGSAIVKYLLEDPENKVYGLSRSSLKVDSENFTHISCDFSELTPLEKRLKLLVKELIHVDGLILAAGFGRFSELEQYSLKQMQTMMDVNFLSQALTCKMLLPNIKKTPESKIIAIASEAALSGANKGSLYCATKFALRGFMQSLRSECARANVGISTVNPGMVRTDFFTELNFQPGEAEENAINAEQIAKAVAFILEMENNCVVEEINLQPLKKVLRKSES